MTLSVVDHLLDLDLALSEARRVLKDDGLLFVWFMPAESDDGHHCQVMSLDGLCDKLVEAHFTINDTILIRETAFVWNPTYLVECNIGG